MSNVRRRRADPPMGGQAADAFAPDSTIDFIPSTEMYGVSGPLLKS